MAIHEIIPNTTGYDEVLAGPEIGVLTQNLKLQKGTAYKRGMLISLAGDVGKQTASGDVAEYVMMRDVDATDATADDTVGTVYVKGRFNREKIIVADGDTVEAHEAELRLRDILFTTLKD